MNVRWKWRLEESRLFQDAVQREGFGMRRIDVARLAGIPVDRVELATNEEMFAAYLDTAPVVVIAVPTRSSATYRRVGTQYYFDDPLFAPVVAVDDLAYDDERGLYDKAM